MHSTILSIIGIYNAEMNAVYASSKCTHTHTHTQIQHCRHL